LQKYIIKAIRFSKPLNFTKVRNFGKVFPPNFPHTLEEKNLEGTCLPFPSLFLSNSKLEKTRKSLKIRSKVHELRNKQHELCSEVHELCSEVHVVFELFCFFNEILCVLLSSETAYSSVFPRFFFGKKD